MSIKQVKIGRPADEKGKSPIICLRIEKELLLKLDRVAEKNLCSRSSVIIHALQNIVKEEL